MLSLAGREYILLSNLFYFIGALKDERLTYGRGSCVAVKTLPLNTDVEIECIAVL